MTTSVLRVEELLAGTARDILSGALKKPKTIYGISFPKSGRTWLHLMLAKLYSDSVGVSIQDVLNVRRRSHTFSPFLKQLRQHGIANIAFDHGFQYRSIARGEKYFPTNFYNKQDILFLFRDPRDVVVSHYYHEKHHFQSFEGTLKEFIRFPFKKYSPRKRPALFGIHPILHYMNAWITKRDIFSRNTILYYEDLKNDPLEGLKHAVEFIGLETSDNALQDAVEYASFDNMQQMEKEGGLQWYSLPKARKREAMKTRKGVVGGYKEELDEEDIAFINDEIQTYLDPFFGRYIKT